MLGSKWNRWLLVGGAALGALAVGCGEDDDPAPAPTYDGGAQLDGGGFDAGGADASSLCYTIGTVTGAQCLGDGGAGYQVCTNGVPGGPCTPFASIIPDAGDGGFQIDASGFFEGGIPDASGVTCPAPLMCQDSLGLKVCSSASPLPGVIPPIPPDCSAKTCAELGLATGTCQDLMGLKVCIQPCAM